MDDFFKRIRSDLEGKYQEYKHKVETAKIFGAEKDKYQEFKEEFDKGIYDLISLQFINEVWFHKGGHESLKESVVGISDYKEKVTMVSKKVDDELLELLLGLNNKTEQWNLTAEIFQSFESLYDGVRRDFLPVKGPIDVFKDYGLMRFAFDKLKCADIQKHIDEILQKAVMEDEIGFRNSLSIIASKLITGVF